MERQSFQKRGPMLLCNKCAYQGARREAIQHFLNEHVCKEEVPFMCGLCRSRHPSQEKLEEHKKTTKHAKMLSSNPALEEMAAANGALFDIKSSNPHPLNIMDSSHAGAEKADLKILGGAQSLRLWQDRAGKRGPKSLKRKYPEVELDLGLDETMDLDTTRKSRRTSSPVPSSPEIPNPPTPHYSPSPVCTRTAPPSIKSNSSRRHSSSQPPSFSVPPSVSRVSRPPSVQPLSSTPASHSSPAVPASVEDTMRALSGQLCIMNSHLATVSSKLSKAVDILTHDQGKVLRELQQMNKILVNMDRRSHQQERNRASDARKILGVLQDFQHSTTSVSSKMESTVSLAGATYQSLTTTLRDQERAVQDLLENHQQRSGEYVPRHVNQHRSRPAFRPISNYRK